MLLNQSAENRELYKVYNLNKVVRISDSRCITLFGYAFKNWEITWRTGKNRIYRTVVIRKFKAKKEKNRNLDTYC